MKFYWIDDLPDRKNAAENLAYTLNWELGFVDTGGDDLQPAIRDLLTKAEPGLIILDHKLQSVKNGLYHHGSAAAAILREQWPLCPIVCVSGVDPSDVTVDQRVLYEAVFPITSISNHYRTIASIADSFRWYRDHPPTSKEELWHLLGCPEDDWEKLKAIVPSGIQNNLSDRSMIRPLSSWIRNVLFKRPGFLYDSLWAATFVGLTEDGFQKHRELFQSAFYTGLFRDASKPRWWKSGLLNILSEKVDLPGLPWEKGRHLPGVSEQEFSSCEMTKEPYPETVGFLDATHIERYPMKLKVTVRDDNFQDMLYFEEIRKFDTES